MAEKQFESEDPMELVGTLMNCSDEELEDMGLTYIDEYARMRWRREDIITVFADPHYRGPHTVYRAKGHNFIESLIDRVMGEPTGQEALSTNNLSSRDRAGEGD